MGKIRKLHLEDTSRRRPVRETAIIWTHSAWGQVRQTGGPALTHLFNQAHEAGPEAPGLVAIALQRTDGHLGKLLDAHGHHVHCVIHEGSVGLKTEKRKSGVNTAWETHDRRLQAEVKNQWAEEIPRFSSRKGEDNTATCCGSLREATVIKSLHGLH